MIARGGCPARVTRWLLLPLLVATHVTGAQGWGDEREFLHPAGFAMTLPAGWRAVPADEGQFQLVPPNAGESEGVLVLAMPAGEIRDVRDPMLLLQTDLEVAAMYPVLSRVGEPRFIDTQAGPGVLSTYQGRPLLGSTLQLSMGLISVDGMAISLMAVGLRREIGPRADEITGIFASTRLEASGSGDGFIPPSPGQLHDGAPAAREWAEFLRGRRLVDFGGYTSGGGSGGFNSQTELNLYANGQFYYSRSSSVSIYVEGMMGGSAGTETLEGLWRVIMVGGQPVLELITEEGRYQDVLERAGREVILGGQRMMVAN